MKYRKKELTEEEWDKKTEIKREKKKYKKRLVRKEWNKKTEVIEKE